MAFKIAYQREEAIPRRRPQKRSGYLSFIHELPCAVTGQYGVQAAHVSFPSPWHGHYGRAKGTKAPDRFALPLSEREHALQHSGKLGTESDYWAVKGIDPHELANALWGIYCDYDEDEAIAKCTSRINQGLAMAGRLKEKTEQ